MVSVVAAVDDGVVVVVVVVEGCDLVVAGGDLGGGWVAGSAVYGDRGVERVGVVVWEQGGRTEIWILAPGSVGSFSSE